MNHNPLNPPSAKTYSKKLQQEVNDALPFSMQIANNPRVQGIYSGVMAMRKSGIQPEFAAGNMIQAKALQSPVILRAGHPPQYNKRRSAKGGTILTKTSSQGFFKGSLSKEERFSRLEPSGIPKAHHPNDKHRLTLKPTDPKYQHVMQLDINMSDILREIAPDGDLYLLGYDEPGFLRLGYKEGRGPKDDLFHGQFIINFSEGTNQPIIYAREWDKPDHHPHWDPIKKIIKKPPELASVPDGIYEKNFNLNFKLGYTEEKIKSPELSTIKPAEVFAYVPQSAGKFKTAMGKEHPQFDLIKDCTSLPQILHRINASLPETDANKLILDEYDKAGSIITGDWDGMILGYSPDLPRKFSEVFNTLAPGTRGLDNQEQLLKRSDAYLKQIKQKAIESLRTGGTLSAFEKKALSITSIIDIVTDFALSRAGNITAHEFVFQHVLNHAYRDEINEHYGETYNVVAIQNAFNRLIATRHTPPNIKDDIEKILKEELKHAGDYLSSTVFNKQVEHLANHLTLAQQRGLTKYTVPHLQHDINIHDLYQHGFDMRNPYGTNLNGAWLLISDDGAILYGETQEQLIEILLTGNFLKKTKFDINHGVDMSAGWGRVIEAQIRLGQTIPAKTLTQYERHVALQARTQIQSDMKALITNAKKAAQEDPKEDLDNHKKNP